MRSPASQLTVNQPGDPYEQEADRVAGQVMRMTAPVNVQRKCGACEQEKHLQRKCAECEEEKQLQKKEAGAGPSAAPPIVHEVLSSPGQPLDPAARAFMEPRFGHDFSQVRVHADSRAAESARAVDALAYTVGNHIAFGHGRFAPHGQAGRQLLAHELTHVLQQGHNRTNEAPAIGPIDPQAVPSGLLQRDDDDDAKNPNAPPAERKNPGLPDLPDKRTCDLTFKQGSLKPEFECHGEVGDGKIDLLDSLKKTLKLFQPKPPSAGLPLNPQCPGRQTPLGTCCPDGQLWDGNKCGPFKDVPIDASCRLGARTDRLGQPCPGAFTPGETWKDWSKPSPPGGIQPNSVLGCRPGDKTDWLGRPCPGLIFPPEFWKNWPKATAP